MRWISDGTNLGSSVDFRLGVLLREQASGEPGQRVPQAHNLVVTPADETGEGTFDTWRVMIDPSARLGESYVLDLPVDRKSLPLILPEYRSAFEGFEAQAQ